MARRSRAGGGRWRAPALVAATAATTFCIAATALGAPGDLVLVAATGEPDYGEVDHLQHRPAISADGRFVAYVQQGGGEGDPLFLRDMQRTEPTALVTPSDPRFPGFDSSTPVFSDSGRYLAFASEEATLSAEDVDGAKGPGSSSQIRDIFVYDRRDGTMKLVSRRSGRRGAAASDDSSVPSISADGRTVAYGTSSSNLTPGKRLTVGGIYTRDLRTEENRLISGVPGIMFWRPSSFSPDISGDGRRVAFGFQYSRTAYDPKAPPPKIFKWLRARKKQIMLWDAEWRLPRVVSRASGRHGAISKQNCAEASVSGSGRFVAFVSQAGNLAPGDHDRLNDVFVRDVRRDVTTLVSAGPRGALPAGESSHPSISADGRYVAFHVLTGEHQDEDSDVFVKDLRTGRVTLVGRGLNGEPSNGRSGAPTITPDGRFVAFGSTSSNISPEVTTHKLAFYRFQLR